MSVGGVRRGERGQSVVEFALGSTLFFGLVFGAVSFGIATYQSNMASNLAQEAARKAAVRGSASGSAWANSDVQDYVNTRAVGAGYVTSTVWSPDNTPGSYVTVTVTKSTRKFGAFFNFGGSVSASSRMVISR